jgi:Na+-transporting methylmalonyl-CoA/oxaloacetate decarboxylase gamma subunit
METTRQPFSPELLEGLIDVFGILILGMAGIFVFMLIFYLIIKILNKVFKHAKEETLDV